MKIRVYPKIPGARPMIFSEADNVLIKHSKEKWTLDFDHIDFIRKDKQVCANSRFTSDNTMAYTLLYESVNDTNKVTYIDLEEK